MQCGRNYWVAFIIDGHIDDFVQLLLIQGRRNANYSLFEVDVIWRPFKDMNTVVDRVKESFGKVCEAYDFSVGFAARWCVVSVKAKLQVRISVLGQIYAYNFICLKFKFKFSRFYENNFSFRCTSNKNLQIEII